MPEVFDEPKPSLKDSVRGFFGGVDDRLLVLVALLAGGGVVLVWGGVLSWGQFGVVSLFMVLALFLKGAGGGGADPLPLDVLIEGCVGQVRKIMRDYNQDGSVVLHEPPRCYLTHEDGVPSWFVLYFFYRSSTSRVLCSAFVKPFSGRLLGVYQSRSGLPSRPSFNKKVEIVPVPNQKYMEEVGVFDKVKRVFRR